MIKFPDLNTIYVTVSDCSKTELGLKCPKCKEHKEPTDKDNVTGDCKTLIYEDELNSEGKLVLRCQCICNSKEHWDESKELN